MKIPRHVCGVETARIDGKTLGEALKKLNSARNFRKFSAKGWVEICPKCDSFAVGLESRHPLPFLCTDGVMRTAIDVGESQTENLFFCNFVFTKSAFDAGIALFRLDDEKTKRVEAFGAEIFRNSDAESALRFCTAVCDWGRGQRVWGKLDMLHIDEHLGRSLNEWFSVVRDASDDEAAISPGIAIHGLGVSFASKHLRMLAPHRYAVLDDVLSEGLGFARNKKGYLLFMQWLRKFQGKHVPHHDIALVEAGIFNLVRIKQRIVNAKEWTILA
jgi:hypothetical protein